MAQAVTARSRALQPIKDVLWAVAVAALLPFPFAVATWTAGAIGMPWRDLFLGSLVRILAQAPGRANQAEAQPSVVGLVPTVPADC